MWLVEAEYGSFVGGFWGGVVSVFMRDVRRWRGVGRGVVEFSILYCWIEFLDDDGGDGDGDDEVGGLEEGAWWAIVQGEYEEMTEDV